MTNAPFCYFHSPQTIEERREARAKGGSKNASATLPSKIPSIQLHNADNILLLIAETIHHVRTGQIDPRIANCIGYLSGIALKAIEQGKTEERIEALEAAIKNNNGKVEKDSRQSEDQLFSFENRG